MEGRDDAVETWGRKPFGEEGRSGAEGDIGKGREGEGQEVKGEPGDGKGKGPGQREIWGVETTRVVLEDKGLAGGRWSRVRNREKHREGRR